MASSISTAPSTLGGYAAAIACFNAFQRQREDPVFDDLKPVHVEGDFLQKLMMDFGEYLAKTDVEKKTKANQAVQAGDPNSSKAHLGGSTKVLYFSKVKESLASKFKDHSSWNNTEWYNSLRHQVETGSRRQNIKSHDTFDSKTLPLYTQINNTWIRAKNRAAILQGHSGYGRDLTEICTLLMREATGLVKTKDGPLQQRVWIVMTLLAVGRGGEVKFQRYDEWHWDVLFENIDANWAEIKTLTQQAMMFGPHKYRYMLDFFHAFACFFSVEKGLYRDPNMDPSLRKFVFTFLHSIADASVASKITTILRRFTHPDMRANTSSKSIRYGMTVILQMLLDISDDELNARGGWATSSNSEHYKSTTPALSTPAMNGLNDFLNTKGAKYAPQLECLGSHVQIVLDVFMSKLYVIDVPFFLPGGRLRPFLRACTASLLMYHWDVVKDLGYRNSVVEAVFDAAQAAKITDGELTKVEDVLHHWSTKIKADFNARNPDSPNADECTLKAMYEQNSSLLQQLLVQSTDNRSVVCDMQRSMEGLQAQVDALSRQVESSQARTSPNRRLKSPPGYDVLAPSVSKESEEELAREPAAQVSVKQKRQSTVASSAPAAAAKKGRFGSAGLVHSSAADVASQSAAGCALSTVLGMLYADGQFRGSKSRLSSCSLVTLGEKDKLFAVLQLVEYVITPEQWETFCKADLEPKVLLDTSKAVEAACMHTMRVEFQKLPPAGKKSREQPYFIGLGSRMVTFKKTTEGAQLFPENNRAVPSSPIGRVTNAFTNWLVTKKK